MFELRHCDEHARLVRAVFHLPAHTELSRQRRKLGTQPLQARKASADRAEYRAHIKTLGQLVIELLGLAD
jgi:hypothetical protein